MIKVTAPHNCSGCRLCALACSFHNTEEHEFSLAAAAIGIDRVGNENSFHPQILDNCTDCGRCVSHCEYGVLTAEQGGQA